MMFTHRFNRGAISLSAIVALLACHLAGCGSSAPPVEHSEVTGKVSYNGDALKMGTVTFQPASGAPATGDIQPDGTYSLQGVVGQNKVMIVSQEKSEGPTGPEAEVRSPPPPQNLIPAKYGTFNSGLTYDVKAGKNTADFELK